MVRDGRIVRVLKKPTRQYLVIGVAAPAIKPNSSGHTYWDPTSYGMWSDGAVWAQGQQIINNDRLPVASVVQPDLYRQRYKEKAFSAGDDVSVTVDCSNCTLRMRTPTVDHTIQIDKSQKEWVLNVNFFHGDYEVKLVEA